MFDIPKSRALSLLRLSGVIHCMPKTKSRMKLKKCQIPSRHWTKYTPIKKNSIEALKAQKIPNIASLFDWSKEKRMYALHPHPEQA